MTGLLNQMLNQKKYSGFTNFRVKTISIISVLMFNFNSFANENFQPSADQRAFYVGVAAAKISPVQKKFKHKKSETDLTLTSTTSYSAKIGYSFYPQLSVELYIAHQPRHDLKYLLPKLPVFDQRIGGSTKANSNVYMLNMVYELQNEGRFKPYFTAGIGLAKVNVKPTKSSFMGVEIFRVNKTQNNCFTWQIGTGLSTFLTPELSFDVAVRLQVTNNVRIKYDKMVDGVLVKQLPIKKKIGIGEISAGVTYKLPI